MLRLSDRLSNPKNYILQARQLCQVPVLPNKPYDFSEYHNMYMSWTTFLNITLHIVPLRVFLSQVLVLSSLLFQ